MSHKLRYSVVLVLVALAMFSATQLSAVCDIQCRERQKFGYYGVTQINICWYDRFKSCATCCEPVSSIGCIPFPHDNPAWICTEDLMSPQETKNCVDCFLLCNATSNKSQEAECTPMGDWDPPSGFVRKCVARPPY
jgi:hypothetical protein